MEAALSPQEFVKRWRETELGERQSYQAHFMDLCRLVGYETPTGTGKDARGREFVFEPSLKKQSGGQGFADVYLQSHFAFEYKAAGKYKDLRGAYDQLLQYREQLQNPPLLVVTDIQNWEIHTNWPNTEKRVYSFKHEDIASRSVVQDYLRHLFFDPSKLHPRRNSEQVTADAAKAFETIANNMRDWKAEPERIAHFLTKLVFCLFAEDVSLLPSGPKGEAGIFSEIIEQTRQDTSRFVKYTDDLFKAMADGGDVLFQRIPYFNGSLFEDVRVEELAFEALSQLEKASRLNWESVEPAIFGTLFERSLDPAKRSQLGAHYTSREDILLIVEPVLMRPLERQWEAIREKAAPLRQNYDEALATSNRRKQTDYAKALEELRGEMLKSLREIKVLDPACGSGNFLYVALQRLMDMEKEVLFHPLFEGLTRPFPEVHPRQMYGIEKDAIAHALASIVVWIGYLQWRRTNGYLSHPKEPILQDIHENIQNMDAILGYVSPIPSPSPASQGKGVEGGRVAASQGTASPIPSPSPASQGTASPIPSPSPASQGTASPIPNPSPASQGTASPIPSPSPASQGTASPIPSPSPASQGKGVEDEAVESLSLRSGERFREGIEADEPESSPRFAHTRISIDIWNKLKPLVRDMRKEPTPAEDLLWQRLRKKQLGGFKFRRQHPIGYFVADFYCADARLVIEVDGSIHEQQQEYDELRQAYIESLGLRVLRFDNAHVVQSMQGVLERIAEALETVAPLPATSPLPNPLPASQGEGVYEPEWPAVDVIIGNPPFLGGNKIRGELGDYVDDLFAVYKGRVPHFADLVTYWFEKARKHVEEGKAKRVGLLATNSIRGGVNRDVLKRIKETGDIFMAWADRSWILDGAAVRVSMVGFDKGEETEKIFDGQITGTINSDLTSKVDITIAKNLAENHDLSFQGPSPKGAFDISSKLAESMLSAKNNSSKDNKEVVKPVLNASDVVRESRNYWTIDFGPYMTEEQAALYEMPFAHIKANVFAVRQENRRQAYKDNWWKYAEARVGMREALKNLPRYLATPRVAKHRIFVWVASNVLSNDALIAIARDDDYFFGVLHSQLHEVWSLRMGTWLGKGNDPRYTPTTTFETFPFPFVPGKEDKANAAYQAISAAAKQLHEEREAWLNPLPPAPSPLRRDGGQSSADSQGERESSADSQGERESSADSQGERESFPLRSGGTQGGIKDRTLTNLYNALNVFRGKETMRVKEAAGDFAPRLDALHQALDKAVCDAYGWPHEILGDEEAILGRLLALNLERSHQASG